MFFMRRLHRETLDFVNRERTKSNRDPMPDLPMGYRGEDEVRNPVATALGRPFPTDQDWKEVDDLEFENGADFIGWLLQTLTGKGAAVVWVVLFEVGFFSRYNTARLFEAPRLRRHQKVLRNMREIPTEFQERYLRARALMRYASRES